MKRAGGTNGLGGLLNIFSSIFKIGGAISISFILVFFNSITAVGDSIEQSSAKPFFKSVGGELLNHDNKLYVEAEQIEQNGGFVKTEDMNTFQYFFSLIGGLGRALMNVWYLFTFGLIFYWLSILLTNNESARASNILLAIIFIAFLQIGANFINLSDSEDEINRDFTLKEKFTPYKGFFKFVKVLPNAFNPVEVANNTTINQTNETQSNNVTNTINML